jgi:hypothetical protein
MNRVAQHTDSDSDSDSDSDMGVTGEEMFHLVRCC